MDLYQALSDADISVEIRLLVLDVRLHKLYIKIVKEQNCFFHILFFSKNIENSCAISFYLHVEL